MRLRIALSIFCVAWVLAVGEIADAQGRPACQVTITSPSIGAKVGVDTLVTGTANVAPGQFLWLFAHRRGLAIWWPQGGAAAEVRNGSYEVLVAIGAPQDTGAEFEITAQVVSLADNTQLDVWVKRTAETSSYPGIRLPSPVAECGVPPRTTVVKTR